MTSAIIIRRLATNRSNAADDSSSVSRTTRLERNHIMKLHEVELAAKKATVGAQAASRKLKEKEQQAKAAEEKSHQAKLKYKLARKESKLARKAARRARAEADDTKKTFTKATALAAKAAAKAAKALKKAAGNMNKTGAKSPAQAGNKSPRRPKRKRPPQLAPAAGAIRSIQSSRTVPPARAEVPNPSTGSDPGAAGQQG